MVALGCMGLPADGVQQLWANQLPLQRVEQSTPESNSAAECRSDASVSALLGLDDQLWGASPQVGGDRQALMTALDQSLLYLATPEAARVYQQYAIPEFTLSRVRRSLERFRQLLLSARSAAELQAAVLEEFDLYQSIGSDGRGTVSFTGYFQPLYRASRTPTSEYRYPLYRLPPQLDQWQSPHPTRLQLEGEDGLQGDRGLLQGLELVWLRDRLEAYLVQVQGSAQLQLTDGSIVSVGYAGRTDYPYTSIGRELVNDGKIPEAELSLPRVMQHFQVRPQDLDLYLPRNDRFIFFEETTGSAALGSLGVPVTPERSIATDKSLMPPGALALIQTQIPYPNPDATPPDPPLVSRLVSRYVLDQDTGGAIQGAGRVDIFMGSGELAGDRAGLINHPGQLYYLLLKE